MEPRGAGTVLKKHIGNPRVEPVIVSLSLGASPEASVADTLELKSAPKDLAVLLADHDFNVRERYAFGGALLSSIAFPSFDAAEGKAPALLKATFVSERVQHATANEKLTVSAAAKASMASNFRLELDGVETSGVSKIEAFTVEQKVASDEVGDQRLPERTAAGLEIDNLVVHVPVAKAAGFQAWHASSQLARRPARFDER